MKKYIAVLALMLASVTSYAQRFHAHGHGWGVHPIGPRLGYYGNYNGYGYNRPYVYGGYYNNTYCLQYDYYGNCVLVNNPYSYGPSVGFNIRIR